jgi:hypothetical protein
MVQFDFDVVQLGEASEQVGGKQDARALLVASLRDI